MKTFYVADMTATGEVRAVTPYTYAELERIPGAGDVITEMSAHLWRTPDEFEVPLLPGQKGLTLRWRASAPTAGVATVRFDQQLASVSLLVTGIHADSDQITLQAFQRHLLLELRDTGFEPSFALLDLQERPLVATVGFDSPAERDRQLLVALADRCFAASLFRYHQLA